MSVSKKDYSELTKKASPGSPYLTNSIFAFISGGSICAFAQVLTNIFSSAGLNFKQSKALVLVVIIAITAALTALGVFDKIAKFAGAGTAVPITGFANSIVSAAMEFQTEGRILGTAAKMFSIAGPVIVFGCSAAALYGLIYYFIG